MGDLRPYVKRDATASPPVRQRKPWRGMALIKSESENTKG